MFNEFSIVSTALSSFNNAALFYPLFFSLALLMLPLFFMVYLYGNDFIAKIGWKRNDIENKSAFFSLLILMVWLLVFGGNYAVIRDGISLLPVMLSGVLFALTIIITQQFIKQKYIAKIPNKKTEWLIFAGLVLLTVFSAPHTWFGVLLQLSAVLCGIIIGSRFNKEMNLMFWSTFLFGAVATLILMQPEYFRFGQLGNLTFIHLLSVLLTGLCAVTVLTTKYTNARSRIYDSAYIKLKWLLRIISLLAFILFVSTESVPVFVGLLTSVALLEMLTIYHSSKNFMNISRTSWAMLLICFGIITICPVVSALGIICLMNNTENSKLADFMRLL